MRHVQGKDTRAVELSRKRFLKTLLTATGCLVAGSWSLVADASRKAVMIGTRPRRYLGRLRPLDPPAVAKPGKWNG